MKRLNRTQTEILILLLFAGVLWIICNIYISHIPNDHPGVVRFHVIANSDTAQDQRLKLIVRDGILAKVEQDLADETLVAIRKNGEAKTDTIELTRAYINKNIGEIDTLAEKIIRDNGYDYTTRSKLSVTFIPEKTYGDMLFPPGNYEALNVVIGEGKGQNWWCVLFPPLCLIDARDHIYKNQLKVTKQEGIVLKSKVAEIVRKYERK